MRAFEDDGYAITEQRRWIYSYKNRVNILLRFFCGSWRDYSDNMSYGFYDEEFLAVKPVLEHSIVGKLGVYLYLKKRMIFSIVGPRTHSIIFRECCKNLSWNPF